MSCHYVDLQAMTRCERHRRDVTTSRHWLVRCLSLGGGAARTLADGRMLRFRGRMGRPPLTKVVSCGLKNSNAFANVAWIRFQIRAAGTVEPGHHFEPLAELKGRISRWEENKLG
jgi:hypothetical protein